MSAENAMWHLMFQLLLLPYTGWGNDGENEERSVRETIERHDRTQRHRESPLTAKWEKGFLFLSSYSFSISGQLWNKNLFVIISDLDWKSRGGTSQTIFCSCLTLAQKRCSSPIDLSSSPPTLHPLSPNISLSSCLPPSPSPMHFHFSYSAALFFPI